MKFSIIIITYNRAHLITETIESVLKQTYQNFELIIIDDDSTDNTEEVISDYKKNHGHKIRYIKSKKTGTPSKLRNIGLQNAKGDIISILDSDDLWLEKKLEEMYAIFSQHEDVKFVIHNLQHFTKINELKEPFYKYKKTFFKDIKNELLLGEILAFPVFSMRISLLQEIGFFDEEIMEGQHDYYLRVATNYKIFYLNKPLTLMRRHNSNLTKNFDILHCLDAIKSYDKLKEAKKLNPKQYSLASNLMNLKIAKYYIQNKDTQKSNEHIDRILNHSAIFSKWYVKSKILKLMKFRLAVSLLNKQNKKSYTK